MKKLPAIRPEWLAGITMTSEQKAKWLAALRSGEYNQTWGELYSSAMPAGYCCLGLFAHSVLGLADQRIIGLNHLTQIDCSSLGEWTSADWSHPEPNLNGIQETLAYLNDVQQLSFAEISNFIESNIPACDEVPHDR